MATVFVFRTSIHPPVFLCGPLDCSTTAIHVCYDTFSVLFFFRFCPLHLQVIYPVFVVGMMCRVIFARVLPDAGGMTFTLTEKDRYYARSDRRCQRFFSRVLQGVWVGGERHLLQTHSR